MEIYAHGLISAIRNVRRDLRMTAFMNSQAAVELAGSDWLDGVDVVRLPLGPGRASRILSEQFVLPRLARTYGVDVLHSTASTAPSRLACANVVTIHDLIYKRYPNAHSRLARWGLEVTIGAAARRADRIIADSRATASDLATFLDVRPERIDVVWIGMTQWSRLQPTPEPELRQRFNLGDSPYVLSVSAFRPHKNVERLIEALALVDREPAPNLMLCGYSMDEASEMERLADRVGVRRRVRFCGWIDDADLESAYENAACLVLPSLWEGFGLPVVEAMRHRVPVACSNRASLPEIVGDAALLFDPERPRAIADAITSLLTDADLRRDSIRRGVDRLPLFDWHEVAQRTLSTYEEALESRRS